MRIFLLVLLLAGLASPAWSQVYTDSSSDDADSAPAAVGAPGRYYLNTGPMSSSNTVEVGRPYPYYPYYYGAYPYGAYPGAVQGGMDPNDPNYFPMDAALGATAPKPGTVKPSSGGTKPKKTY